MKIAALESISIINQNVKYSIKNNCTTDLTADRRRHSLLFIVATVRVCSTVDIAHNNIIRLLPRPDCDVVTRARLDEYLDLSSGRESPPSAPGPAASALSSGRGVRDGVIFHRNALPPGTSLPRHYRTATTTTAQRYNIVHTGWPTNN